MVLSLGSKNASSVVIRFDGDYQNYEFAINDAFVSPTLITGNQYSFSNALNANTTYVFSLYNFVNNVVTTKVPNSSLSVTTDPGPNFNENNVFSVTSVSENTIRLSAIPGIQNFFSLNDGFSDLTISQDESIWTITNLEPKTWYSIRYETQNSTAILIVQTTPRLQLSMPFIIVAIIVAIFLLLNRRHV